MNKRICPHCGYMALTKPYMMRHILHECQDRPANNIARSRVLRNIARDMEHAQNYRDLYLEEVHFPRVFEEESNENSN